MASDISKIDTDRHPDPGMPAWNFRDKVIRRLLHGKQSLPSGGPAHPIYHPYDSFPGCDERIGDDALFARHGLAMELRGIMGYLFDCQLILSIGRNGRR